MIGSAAPAAPPDWIHREAARHHSCPLLPW